MFSNVDLMFCNEQISDVIRSSQPKYHIPKGAPWLDLKSFSTWVQQKSFSNKSNYFVFQAEDENVRKADELKTFKYNQGAAYEKNVC